jgi:diguanylate cyclase (GGDEF)-like protein
MVMNKPRDRRGWQKGPSDYADVQIELIEIMFRGLLPTVLLSTIGLLGNTALLAHHYGDSNLWRFVFVIGVICVLRLGSVIAFASRRRRKFTLEAALQWQRVYGTFTFLYCLSLACATLYAGWHLDVTAWILTTMGTFALCAGIGARVGMRPWITNCCCFTMVAALCIAFFPRGLLLCGSGCLLATAFTIAQYTSIQVKFEIMVEQIRSRRKHRTLSEQDMLTGLSNRRHFETKLRTAVLQHLPVAILFIDLDGFKGVNDTFGHATGDALLQQVSRRLLGAVCPVDLVARLGGDEFAILHAAVATETTAHSLAERLTHAISLPFIIGERLIFIGASIGVRLSDVRDDSSDKLLSDADHALYSVKQAGGKAFAFANFLPIKP